SSTVDGAQESTERREHCQVAEGEVPLAQFREARRLGDVRPDQVERLGPAKQLGVREAKLDEARIEVFGRRYDHRLVRRSVTGCENGRFEKFRLRWELLEQRGLRYPGALRDLCKRGPVVAEFQEQLSGGGDDGLAVRRCDLPVVLGQLARHAPSMA